ncbi:MAG: hypothetical protein HQK89_12445 [Nitrospirae bacterium]|nr:hypothetical protein [Nitrospirota bacterium]
MKKFTKALTWPGARAMSAKGMSAKGILYASISDGAICRILLSIFVFCIVSVTASKAYTAVGMSTEEIAKSSDVVIVGVVDKVKSVWDKKEGTIISNADVKVKEVIKGKLDKKLVKVEYEGGTVGDISFHLSSGVSFTKGEEVIVFLKVKNGKPAGSPYLVYGDVQGKYTVKKDKAEKNVSSLESNLENVDAKVSVAELIKKVKSIQ